MTNTDLDAEDYELYEQMQEFQDSLKKVEYLHCLICNARHPKQGMIWLFRIDEIDGPYCGVCFNQNC
jgi:hypothetical protein